MDLETANFDLPKGWWPYAIVYAAYICNRCPSQAIENMTPFQLRYGKIADMSKIEYSVALRTCLSPTPWERNQFTNLNHAFFSASQRSKMVAAAVSAVDKGMKTALTTIPFLLLTGKRANHSFKRRERIQRKNWTRNSRKWRDNDRIKETDTPKNNTEILETDKEPDNEIEENEVQEI